MVPVLVVLNSMVVVVGFVVEWVVGVGLAVLVVLVVPFVIICDVVVAIDLLVVVDSLDGVVDSINMSLGEI